MYVCLYDCLFFFFYHIVVTVVNCLIVTRLDYCNSLFVGSNKQLIDKLQRMLDCAAAQCSASYIRRKLSIETI